MHSRTAQAGENLLDLRDQFDGRLLAVHCDRRIAGVAIGARSRIDVGRAQSDLDAVLYPGASVSVCTSWK